MVDDQATGPLNPSGQYLTVEREKINFQLTGSNRSILVAEILLDQVLQRKNGVMSGGIQGNYIFLINFNLHGKLYWMGVATTTVLFRTS